MLSPAPDALRLSVTVTFMPGTRKQAWVARRQISSTSMTASGSKISKSGQNRTRVPVLFFEMRLALTSAWPFEKRPVTKPTHACTIFTVSPASHCE